MRWRIGSVLTVSMALLVTLAVGSITVVDGWRQWRRLHQELEAKGLLLAEVLDGVLSDALYFDDVERTRHLSELLDAIPEVACYRVFDRNGRLLVDSTVEKYPRGTIDAATLTLATKLPEASVTHRQAAIEIVGPIRAGADVLGGVVLELDTGSLATAIRGMVVRHLWQGAFALLIGVALSAIVARRLTAPVRGLIKAARRIASGDLQFKAEPWRHDELGELAVAFEEMAHKLELRAREQGEAHTAELEKANDLLRQHALQDALTGLPNRRLLLDRLQVAAAEADRRQELLAVLFLDLDHFKVINDSLGHSFGDELLRAVAERLQREAREVDTVARLGGDEFTILLPDLTAAEEASRIAQSILDSLRLPFAIGGRELLLTASIGVSLYPQDGRDIGELLKNADIAMYHAKELGRNNCQSYARHMGHQAFERMELESDIRRAIAEGELAPHFQPVLGLASGTITGFEALLRWEHPTRGLLEAAEFVPMLEHMGQMNDLDALVLRQGCKLVRGWQRRFRADLRLAVNLSARHFKKPDLAGELRDSLAATGFDPHRLEIEITETTAIANEERSIHTLRALQEMGIGISIDDFGTGYSSFSYLRYYPVSRIKIDREFVRNLPYSDSDAAIIRAVTSLAHSLGIRVTAEGVESEEQLRFLARTGCDEAQGHWFHPPLSPAECEELLRDRPTIEKTWGAAQGGGAPAPSSS